MIPEPTEALPMPAPDDECDICGKTLRQHNMGHGYPMCGIYAVFRASREPEAGKLREALEDARAAIASLDEFALGGADIADTHTGDSAGQYGIRDELLAKIDTALSSNQGR
jgi:hypothetical protein